MAAPSPPGPDDSGFRALVIEVLERIEREGPAALEHACRAHPQAADRLRRRVAALGDLGLVEAGAPRAAPERVGDFRLLEPIGAGGMGIVYRAVQESLGREVALKLIRPEILGLPKARERFARETSIVARLQHPGIVPVYTVGGAEELPYYAMEWVRGCTLAEALSQLVDRGAARLEGPDLERAVRARSDGAERLPEAGCYLYAGSWEAACLRIARHVAEALEHAHRRGVLHRDVKPGNVMLTPDGRVMLLDFGLSQASGEDVVTRTGERLGSLPYMPPELLEAGPAALDERSDVYSLGVTLYQMLTLELPFAAKSEPAAVLDILEGRPRRPRERLPSLSWEAETVCLAALERDPARRYASAADLARDLENALERRPVEARRAGLPLRARRFVHRRPGAAAALLLGLLLVVGVPSLVAWFQGREARTAKASLAAVQAEQRRTEEQRRLAEEQRASAERQHARAEESYAVALATVDTLLRKVSEERLDRIPGMVALRGELAAAAEQVYRRLLERRPDDPELVRLAAGCQRVRAVALDQQGREEEARALLRAAVESLEPWLASGSYELRRVHALGLFELGSLEDSPARHARAREALYELLEERPDDLEVQAQLLKTAGTEVAVALLSGDRAEGLARVARLEDEARALAEERPGTSSDAVLAEALRLHGKVLWGEGRHAAARDKYDEAIELLHAVVEAEPDRLVSRYVLATSSSELGGLLPLLGRTEDALLCLEQAQPELEWLVEQFPGDPQHLYALAKLHKNRGVALHIARRLEEAGDAFERARAQYESLERRFPEYGGQDFELAMIALSLGTTLGDRGETERALASIDESQRHLLAALEDAPDDPLRQSWRGNVRVARANVLLKAGRAEEAAEELVEAPRLAAHRLDQVAEALDHMALAVDLAREQGDPETTRRTEDAVRRGLASALARGDAERLPSLAALRARLELP